MTSEQGSTSLRTLDSAAAPSGTPSFSSGAAVQPRVSGHGGEHSPSDPQSTQKTKQPSAGETIRPSRRVRLASGLLAAVAVFTTVAAVGELQFRGVAVLRFAQDLPPRQVASLRSDLVELLAAAGPGTSPAPWTIDATPDGISFSAVAPTPKAARETVDALARQFLDHIERQRQKDAESPTDAERLVAEEMQSHRDLARATQSRLEQEKPRLDSQMASRQDGLLLQWRDLRAGYEQNRARLDAISQAVAIAEAKGPPQIAEPPAGQLEAAVAADEALQQDAKELAVHVRGLGAELNSVGQWITQRVAEASHAATSLAYDAAKIEHETTEQRLVDMLRPLSRHAGNYEAQAKDFHRRWDLAAASMTEDSTEPYHTQLPELQERLHLAWGDFLHSAGPQIEAMENARKLVGDDPAEAARRFEALSTVSRSLQSLVSSHRRLVAEAGRIDPTSNFRLDAALRGTRALRSRCRARIQFIRDALVAAELVRAESQYLARLDADRKLAADLQRQTDAMVAALVKVHGELVDAMIDAHGHIAASARAEIYELQLSTAQQDLSRVQNRLEGLVRARTALSKGKAVELVSTSADRLPVDFSTRLWTAGLAAAVAFMAMLLGQFWNSRNAGIV